jgi:hypothetical protein
VTFGELWQLIERNRISPDLRVVYYSGRFGLSDRFATIFNGKEEIINVPIGELPIDKVVFIWDDNYELWKDKVRAAAPPAGTILKRLADRKLIKTNRRIDSLIAMSRNPVKVEIYNEKSEVLVDADSREELLRQIDMRLRRQHGLVG